MYRTTKMVSHWDPLVLRSTSMNHMGYYAFQSFSLTSRNSTASCQKNSVQISPGGNGTIDMTGLPEASTTPPKSVFLKSPFQGTKIVYMNVVLMYLGHATSLFSSVQPFQVCN